MECLAVVLSEVTVCFCSTLVHALGRGTLQSPPLKSGREAPHAAANSLLWLAAATLACAASAEAPASAKGAAPLPVKISGSPDPRDFVTIVGKDMREGGYDAHACVDKPNVQLTPQATAGDYELRLLGAAGPYPTLARRALEIEAVTATLDAPSQVAAGSQFQVRWTGPANARDYIAIASLAGRDGDGEGNAAVTL